MSYFRSGLRVGDRVSAGRGFYRHVGIVSRILPDGTVLVISASKQKRLVVEETLAEFAGGQPVRNDGFGSHLPHEVVVALFRQMLGQPWTLFRNCEHYASSAEGKQPSSPQLAGWLVAGWLVYAANKRSA